MVEPLNIQLARETLAAIDNGTELDGGMFRMQMGDAKPMPYGEAMQLAQSCINEIEAAGFKAY